MTAVRTWLFEKADVPLHRGPDHRDSPHSMHRRIDFEELASTPCMEIAVNAADLELILQQTLAVRSVVFSASCLLNGLLLGGSLPYNFPHCAWKKAVQDYFYNCTDVLALLPPGLHRILLITSVRSEPLYLHLAKALNGLRIASQEWICYLSGIVGELKLSTDGLEPCLFAGELRPGVPCLILVYLDDLLIAAPTAADVDKVINTIGKQVVLRKTGIIEASHSGGGQLKFLGRLLCRQ